MYSDEKQKGLPSGSQEEPKQTRITSKGIGITAICALLMAFGIAWARGLFEQADVKGVFFVLSDSFLVPGAIYMGIAGLTWVATFGMFDIMGFGCSSLFGRFIPFDSVHRRKETYYDYKTKRDERGRTWKAEMLVVGGAFFLLSIILTVIYSVL